LLSDNADDAVADAQDALGAFSPALEKALNAGFRRKLGLTREEDDDVALTSDLLRLMAEAKADFTLTFRRLSDAAAGSDAGARALFPDPAPFDQWCARWRARAAREASSRSERQEAMRAVNPIYIPRNHRVEAVIRAATDEEDFRPFDELLAVLARPFEERQGLEGYAAPPEPGERVLQTFCGT
jgi:uncharacterized protein YdiU (UPF0061 family)